MSKNKYITELEELKSCSNFRELHNALSENVIDLSSNDYLGLSSDEKLKQDFINQCDLQKLNFSASSSRLLSGNSKEYKKLEYLIASKYERQSCLVFNSGYHANTGILPALAKKNDLIIADKLVHASLIDGMQLSKADFIRYNHLDYKHLEQILSQKSKDYNQIFIVSESVFSMDGDKADLQQLVEIKKRYSTFLYVDEAHALGVLGKNGLGLAENYQIINEIDFLVATLGKAIASLGAFVVCDKVFANYLINKARTLIFTTALPPVNIAWSSFIISQLADFTHRRSCLADVSNNFAKMLGVKPQSHIIPFVIGENAKAIQVSAKLQEAGFNALPIRYPTVPKGTARLRFSLSADMNLEQLKPIIEVLNR